jgi:hypothetical protein
MILGLSSDPFKSPFFGLVLKYTTLFASFPDCTTLCEGMPDIFRLNFEGSNNGSEGPVFLEFIQCKRM